MCRRLINGLMDSLDPCLQCGGYPKYYIVGSLGGYLCVFDWISLSRMLMQGRIPTDSVLVICENM